VPVNPWYTTTLDLAIVLSLLHWRPKGQDVPFTTNFRHLLVRAVAVFAVWLAVGLPAAVAMVHYADTTLSEAGDIIGNGKIVVLEPKKWVGKKFPLLNYIDIGGKLKDGMWLVILYHYDCPKCLDAVRHWKQIAEKAGVHDVALVEMPPCRKPPSVIDSKGFTLVHGRLSDRQEWFAETPVVLTLRDGKIVEADQASRLR
jgi:hypothetical protein